MQHPITGGTYTRSYLRLSVYKKGKYIEACFMIQFHFTPLVLSVDDVMGEEKKAEIQQLYDALLKIRDR